MALPIVANLDGDPEVLIIGGVGAQDLLLFEFTESRLANYVRHYRKKPRLVRSLTGKKFIVVNRKWGGAVHYLIQGLRNLASSRRVVISSVVTGDSRLAELQNDLASQGIQYHFVKRSDLVATKYYGIVFANGDRYWSNKLIELGTARDLSVDCLPPGLNFGVMTILVTQPLHSLAHFIRVQELPQVAIQLFENDLPLLYTNKALAKEIWHFLRSKSVLINFNEIELWLAGSVFLGLDNLELGNLSSLDLAMAYDRLIDRFTYALEDTLFAVGLGPVGSMLAIRSNYGYLKICIPALNLDGAFGVGAGDVAWAYLIGEIFNQLEISGGGVRVLRNIYPVWNEEIYSKILRTFTLGGAIGALTPNIFVDRPTTFRSEMDDLLTAQVERLPIFLNMKSLMQYYLERHPDFIWAPHQSALEKRRNVDEWEDVIGRAFSSREQISPGSG